MRCGEAISVSAHTGHSEEIHSPPACASTVVRRTSPASSSIVVVWIIAISCKLFETNRHDYYSRPRAIHVTASGPLYSLASVNTGVDQPEIRQWPNR